MCIRDRYHMPSQEAQPCRQVPPSSQRTEQQTVSGVVEEPKVCLLYTSPSPRDGHLSIRRQRQDVYKRQVPHAVAGSAAVSAGPTFVSTHRTADRFGCSRRAQGLSLIHISEPTRRTPIYSSAASRCV